MRASNRPRLDAVGRSDGGATVWPAHSFLRRAGRKKALHGRERSRGNDMRASSLPGQRGNAASVARGPQIQEVCNHSGRVSRVTPDGLHALAQSDLHLSNRPCVA